VWSFDRNLKRNAPIARGLGRNSRPLQKNFAYAAELFQKLTPDAATISASSPARRKKSKADLAELELILEILQS
jgi:hypothetical protein